MLILIVILILILIRKGEGLEVGETERAGKLQRSCLFLQIDVLIQKSE
jgi:hypothetical protein